jgi:alpha-D-ribose 1-methylphosphonate 5-triphosphate diphosphatase
VTVAIVGGRVLRDDGTVTRASVLLRDGRIAEIRPDAGPVPGAAVQWQAEGLLVLPGIVDLHGDGFERQIMPRPGVDLPLDVALLDTDRQLVASGITTAFHGVTWSWEPGLRGEGTATRIVDTIAGLGPRLACDTRVHLRHEIGNLDAESRIAAWLAEGRIHLLAFNDHLDNIAGRLDSPVRLGEYLQRSGLSHDAFRDLVGRVVARRDAVPDTVERLAGLAWDHGVPVASHDDETPAGRHHMHQLGSRLCEFPVDLATARAARTLGDAVILGAPNILRGGSHCGRLDAAWAVGEGLCTILASDYYYPSLMQAVFRLAEVGVAVLSDAWSLIAANPADALGLADRGRLAEGLRADLLLVDDRDRALPKVVATFVNGACVHSAVDPAAICLISGAAMRAAE